VKPAFDADDNRELTARLRRAAEARDNANHPPSDYPNSEHAADRRHRRFSDGGIGGDGVMAAAIAGAGGIGVVATGDTGTSAAGGVASGI